MEGKKTFLENLLQKKDLQNKELAERLTMLFDLLELGESILGQGQKKGLISTAEVIGYSILARKAIFFPNPAENYLNLSNYLIELSKRLEGKPYELSN